MDSKRQHKFSRQMQKDLSDIFVRDSRHFFGNNLVTITGVEVAVDLSLAKVYFSVFPISQAKEVMFNLNDRKGEIRGKLGHLIGKRTRKIPELAFFLDDTEEKAHHMDTLIESLNIPPEEGELNEHDKPAEHQRAGRVMWVACTKVSLNHHLVRPMSAERQKDASQDSRWKCNCPPRFPAKVKQTKLVVGFGKRPQLRPAARQRLRDHQQRQDAAGHVNDQL